MVGSRDRTSIENQGAAWRFLYQELPTPCKIGSPSRRCPALPRDNMVHSQPDGGLFIVLEGADGVGKTTLAQALAGQLETMYGRTVHQLREPGGTRVGESIRTVLKGGRGTADPRVDLLLFSAARCELIHRVVEPALGRGEIVLLDRFSLSTLVYQGELQGVPADEIEQVTRIATRGRRPDLTFVLTLDPAEWRRRIESRAGVTDRFEQLASHAALQDAYVRLAAQDPGGRCIAAEGSPAEVLRATVREVQRHVDSRVARRVHTGRT